MKIWKWIGQFGVTVTLALLVLTIITDLAEIVYDPVRLLAEVSSYV